MTTKSLRACGGGDCESRLLLLLSLLLLWSTVLGTIDVRAPPRDNLPGSGLAQKFSILPNENLLRTQFLQNWKRANSPDYALNSIEEDEEELEDEIMWGPSCSPMMAWARKYQDLHLMCEAWVPSGSSFTWYKDDVQQTELENYIDNTSQLDLDGYEQVFSFLFLDCTQEAHEGLYRLVITTPTGLQKERTFNLRLRERTSNIGNGCRWSNSRLAPARITDFSRTVIAVRGKAAMVRCHIDRRGSIPKWRFNKTPVFNSTKHEIHLSGDLIIHDVTPADAGKYSCRARSRGHGISDRITAFLYLD
ncbi:uncharacterized protein LOC143022733 [Oratosquilla oratoria]|uniref:uncharacterized protein LOC143022733 n=1 Tax=Oratosquilla oratoria TaxID=337810 RepID=UPI003F767F62